MSEVDRGIARAEGAFDNFIAQMKQEMIDKDRSPEYENMFWLALNNVMQERINF